MLAVDDGSSDNPQEVCESESIPFVASGQNRGVGHALQEGFRVAREKRCRTIITPDADGAHDPGDIPGMISYKEQNGFRMIVGNRLYDSHLSGIPGFWFLYEMLFGVFECGSTGSCPVNVRYDASDLWFTKKRELLELLDVCRNRSADSSVLLKLQQICDMIMRDERFTVCFTAAGDKGPVFCPSPD